MVELKLKLENLKQTVLLEKKYRRKTNSLPVLLGYQYDENFISDYLAILLNPDKTSCGKKVINKILARYDLNAELVKSNDRIEVYREYPLSNNSRIDIWIELNGKPLIVIENKVNSGEGDNQTNRYSKEITKENPDSSPLLLYLSPRGACPECNDFKVMNYENMADLLSELLKDPNIDADENFITRHFIKYVKETFVNNDEISESTKLFMNYYDIIKEVRERYDAESRNLFEKFELLVKMVFDEESGWAVKWNPKSDWHSIRKKGWNGENVDIHIEFHIDRNQFMLEDSYKVMIDIEGKDKTLVKDTLFDKIPKNAIEDLKSKDYELLPGHRSVALIYKRFQHSVKLYEVPIEEFTRELMNLKQDWNILISIIDEYVNNKKC